MARPLIAGGVVSTTVTLNDAEPLLPAASVAEHATRVVLSGKTVPLAGVHDAPRSPSTLSWALALKVTAAPDADTASRMIDDGTDTTGGVRSRTVTDRVTAPDDAPAVSVTTTVRVYVPGFTHVYDSVRRPVTPAVVVVPSPQLALAVNASSPGSVAS